ncbi:MAG: zinc ribbon domain-containing protein [Phycisphaerae bacterium]|nr:zinc ribbon domain-containing protein [Phycisphaerae bacterium]
MTPIVFLMLVLGVIGALMILRNAARRQSLHGDGRSCPRCGAANRGHARFCAQCGSPLV